MVARDASGVVMLTGVLGQTEAGTPQPSVPGAVVPGAPGGGEGTVAPTQPLPGPQQQPQPGFPGGFLWILILGMVLMLVMTSRTGRKQKKEREAMLASLKRNDRVQTVGGIVGSIVELTDSEMVLRVDEASNTRIRFARSATQQIVREGKDGGRAGDLEAKPKSEAAATK